MNEFLLRSIIIFRLFCYSSVNHLAPSVQYRTEHQFILCLIVPILKYLSNDKTPNEIFLCLSQWASIYILYWVLSVSIKRHMYICIFVCMYACVYVLLAFMAQIISDWTMRRWCVFFFIVQSLGSKPWPPCLLWKNGADAKANPRKRHCWETLQRPLHHPLRHQWPLTL